jgi:hypothetical protein
MIQGPHAGFLTRPPDPLSTELEILGLLGHAMFDRHGGPLASELHREAIQTASGVVVATARAHARF